MRYDWISFTTDYGLEDPFVGICHGVIARIASAARIIDLSHTVPPGEIRHGAFTLAQAVRYLPPAVHLAVVDPGVGTARRAVAVVARDGLLVGPDNGLLLAAAAELGGALAAYELREPEYRLPDVSATFHGRDIFAPAAAHLATGVPPERLGPAVGVRELERVSAPAPTVRLGAITTEVLMIDHFGNIQLAAPAGTLADAGFDEGQQVTIHMGEARHIAVIGRTFEDVENGELILLVDSAGMLALAINGASAATKLGLVRGHFPECVISGPYG